MEELVEKLRQIGLNSYEAKVYLALLKKNPLTGYEVSKLSNIPQARAYDTLKALEADNIVICDNNKPAKYLPVNPKDLVKSYKKKINSTLDFLDKKLPDIKESYSEPVISVTGYLPIVDKIIEAIKAAKKNIFIEVWGQDFKYLESHLLDAYNRGLSIKITGLGEGFRSNFGTVFTEINSLMLPTPPNQRLLFITIDDEECFLGEIFNSRKTSTEFLWTKNPEIVRLTKGFIMNNMCISDIEMHFPEQLKYFYGAGLKKLRDKIIN